MPTRHGTDYLLDTTTTLPPPISEDGAGGDGKADAAQDTPGFQEQGELSITDSLLMAGVDASPVASTTDVDDGNQALASEAEDADARSRTDADVADVAHSQSSEVETHFDQGAAWPPASSTHPSVQQDDRGMTVDRSSQDEPPFVHPRRSIREERSRSPRMVLDTTRKYFRDEFEDSESDTGANHQPQRQDRSPRSWAEMDDEGGFGEIPEGWTQRPSSRSRSPSLEVPLAFDNILDEVMRALSPEAQGVLLHRAKDLRRALLVNAVNVQKGDQPRTSDDAKGGLESNDDHATSRQRPTHPIVNTEGRRAAPKVDKGKQKDPRENSILLRKGQKAQAEGILDPSARRKRKIVSVAMPIEETDQQLVQDARVASLLKERLDKTNKNQPVSGSKSLPSSQIPRNSYVYKVINKASGNSSSSGSDDGRDSSSSSDSISDLGSLGSEPSEADSDDSRRTKKRKKKLCRAWKDKLRKLQLEQANAKPEPPFVYNGEANFHTFQKWTLEVRDWIKRSYIRRRYRVSRLKKYVGGRASTFYMRDGDVQPQQLAAKFWGGADRYLRVKWAEAGFDRETSSLDELATAAERFEYGDKIRRAEESKRDYLSGKSRQTDNTRLESRPMSLSRNQKVSERKVVGTEQQKPTTTSSTTGQETKRAVRMSQPSAGYHKKLTRKEMDEYRAQGKCFECDSTGHLAKDLSKAKSGPGAYFAPSGWCISEVNRTRTHG
jgi:hypothetical protein